KSAMKVILLCLLGVSAATAASAVEDLVGILKISEGIPLALSYPWHRDFTIGAINKLIITKNFVDLSPAAVEITATAEGLTMKAHGMKFEMRATAEGTLFTVGKSYDIIVSGTIDNFERQFACDSPATVGDDCAIQVSNENAEVNGDNDHKAAEAIKSKIKNMMCKHIYFIGISIANAVKEVGFANLKSTTAKGAAEIKA
ncbi:hypothetical protein PFISCL1PPCAC_9145, partial [Pristionchus fissidentatus]